MNIAREVICPFCEHKYMTIILNAEESDYLISRDGKQVKGWIDKCPACGAFVVVIENILRGMEESNLPVDTKRFYRLT